jgi:glutaredoxin
MFDRLVFQQVAGSDTSRRIRMLALSTCGFCRRGQEFLERHGLAYEFVHLDGLDAETKAATKAEFKERFGASLSYPALIVDEAAHTIGYVRRQWEDLLGLPHEEEHA